MKEIKVWDIQTRIFHWSLAILIAFSFLTSDITKYFCIKLVHSDMWLASHVAVGTAVLVLLIFRMLWGFIGPAYSRFNSFHLHMDKLGSYIKDFFKKQKPLYIGHNPGASWAVIVMITLSLLEVLTGVVLYGIEEGRGFLRFLHDGYYHYSALTKYIHYATGVFLVTVIAIHISGVLFETLRHKTGIIKSMFTGKKRGYDYSGRIQTGMIRALASFFLIALTLPAGFYVYNKINSYKPSMTSVPVVYKNECGSCHMGFTPNMLPAKGWKLVMADLSDHFGDDASIDEPLRKEIENYLLENSAETSKEEASIKLTASIKGDQMPAAITKISYWKDKHDNINNNVFKHDSVKSKSNCVACHKWAEYGSFEDNDIKIPTKAEYAKAPDKKENIFSKLVFFVDKNFNNKRF
ncbi:MAG: cytochrome b/b6 domain-containing protein [Nitrospiraceae bacterium]|nr:cytochrome b/b6 domain-containing protein [Nitrospiraceae bacterium]